MLQPYAPKNLAAVDAQYRSAANPPAWVGMDVWGAAICFNTIEAQKQGLPKPTSWADLTKPVYAGKIVMPHPASSGTGLPGCQRLAADDGRTEGLVLHGRPAQEHRPSTTHSGSKLLRRWPPRREFPIGIAFEYRAMKSKKEGAPIDIVLPAEGLGWDIEATAIIKGTKNLDAARKLADFSASSEAMALYEKNFAVLAIPGIAKPDPLLPADYEKRLIKNDFTWAQRQSRSHPRRMEQALRRQG
ncbi:ABC transporter substrate-binding protein [Cupriavidus basilensis]